MPIAALSGPQYLREGLKLILSPGLRLFVILPLTVNLLLFAGIIYFSMRQFGGWVDTLMPRLPEWLMFLEYILWPLFVVLVPDSGRNYVGKLYNDGWLREKGLLGPGEEVASYDWRATSPAVVLSGDEVPRG